MRFLDCLRVFCLLRWNRHFLHFCSSRRDCLGEKIYLLWIIRTRLEKTFILKIFETLCAPNVSAMEGVRVPVGLRPAAFFLPKKRRFRGRGFAKRMAGMSDSNRPRRSAQNGVLETKSVLQEARKRQKETGSHRFEIPSHIIPEKPWTYDHGIRDKRGENMFSAAVPASKRRLFPSTETSKRKPQTPL